MLGNYVFKQIKYICLIFHSWIYGWEKSKKVSIYDYVLKHLVKQMLHHGEYMTICIEDLSLLEICSGEPDL